MEEVDALRQQHAELAALLSPLAEEGWQRPTRCEGWSVADVVLHLAQTDELAIASVAGRFPEQAAAMAGPEGRGESVDDAAAVMVEVERVGLTPAALRRRWSDAAAGIEAALAGCDPSARVQWVAGTLSARTLATTRLAEAWIHTGDVADALGVALAPAERLRHVARLAWRTLPYAFARAGRDLHGPVVFDLTGPSGARWRFAADESPTGPATTIAGDGVELCLVAARRADPAATSLQGAGPDADAVLELVRTYA